uniref:RNA cytidine acetyltransferase n=1 Tax=Neospora caninum (strain Liverpool) TaxID=572307 RepID=A0A0F7UPW2_NEOCL|nr:TPA: Predicted P-loop ATPase fused to an acetyltransferase (ISS), related [Neospora caninum Liverpool]
MRKRVDPRVRTLVENCIHLGQRSFFVIIGDRGSEQVVNLHYLLHRYFPAQKPSVLWCYKKDLGFSSHRRKRAKQVKKKIQRGLYDPNIDDPFELFMSSTNVRFCYYKDTHTVLGSTVGMCILQDFEAITPNILCRTVETVQGGGIICLLLRSFASLQQLYDLSMDIHGRFKTERFSQVKPRFNERFILSLARCRNCLIVDDELNVLPLTTFSQTLRPLKGSKSETGDESPKGVAADSEALLEKKKMSEELECLKRDFKETPPVGPLINLCLSVDQAKAVLAFLDCLASQASGKSKANGGASEQNGGKLATQLHQTFALTAARGRGKSAALGIAVAAAVAYDYTNIFVSAPSPENVKTLFDFVIKGLAALGLKEHLDFSVTREDTGLATTAHASRSSGVSPSEGNSSRGASRLITGVEVHRGHKQTVTFVTPDKRESLAHADLLVIDEAASIPLPIVKSLFGPYVVLLSSTVHGYEGTGRALSLKLLQDLKQNKFSSLSNNPKGGFLARSLKQLTLTTPIRYSMGDGVEAWLHDLLCLGATEPPKLSEAALPPASKCDLYLVDRDALFSYHDASEAFLHNLLSLFVSSHYKNSPNDLMLMADAPAHLLFALLPPVDEQTATVPDIYCAIQVSIEGHLSKQAIQQALGRGMRPSGDLIPWTLAQQFADEDFGALTGARVVRIACHPSLQRLGYGTAALQQLMDFFEMKGVTLSDEGKNALSSSRLSEPQALAEDEEEDEEEEEEGDEEEDEEGDEEEDEEGEEEEMKVKDGKATKGDEKAKRERKDASVASASDSPSEVAKVWTKKSLRPRPAPPLLSPCRSTRPDFSIDYFGVAFGLSAPLLRFWTRRSFVPVYMRQTVTDVTGEFSCILLRPAEIEGGLWSAKERKGDSGEAEAAVDEENLRKKNRWQGIETDRPANEARHHTKRGGGGGGAQAYTGLVGRRGGAWLSAFACDFRARFLQLLGGAFRRLPSSLALCLVTCSSRSPDHAETPGSSGEGAVFPPLSLANLPNFFSGHDLGRLRKYAQQLADLPLILDLLPSLASLFFNGRFPPLAASSVNLSHLQQVVLLAVGLQRKTPDDVSTEFNIPPNQTLALLNKAVHKFVGFFQKLHEAQVEEEVESQWGLRPAASRRLVVEGGGALLGELPAQSFAEELAEGAKKVKRQQKIELKNLLDALGGEEAMKEHSMDAYNEEDFNAAVGAGRALQGSSASRVFSLKRKNPNKGQKSGAPGEKEGDGGEKKKKPKHGFGSKDKNKHKVYANR